MCKQMTNDGSRTTCWIVNIWPEALIHYMMINPVGNVIGQFNHHVFQFVSKMACNIEETSWGRLNIRMPSYQYNGHHAKDRTVSPTVLSLTWESPYLGKTVFILRRGPDYFFCLYESYTHPGHTCHLPSLGCSCMYNGWPDSDRRPS